MNTVLAVFAVLIVMNQVMFSAAIGDEILGDKEGNNFLKRKLGMTKRMFNLQEECCNEGCDNEEVWEMRTDVNAAQYTEKYC